MGQKQWLINQKKQIQKETIDVKTLNSTRQPKSMIFHEAHTFFWFFCDQNWVKNKVLGSPWGSRHHHQGWFWGEEEDGRGPEAWNWKIAPTSTPNIIGGLVACIKHEVACSCLRITAYYNWLPVLGWLVASTMTGSLRLAGCTYYNWLPVLGK